jgi:hypothetical protein
MPGSLHFSIEGTSIRTVRSTRISEILATLPEREGVLGDDLLHQLSQRYPPGSDALLKLPEELQEFVGRNQFADLRDWFVKNFKPTISSYHFWLHSFWQMLRAKSSGVSFRIPPPLEDAQCRQFSDFVTTIMTRKKR